MAGFKIEVPKYPKMSIGGIIDAYSKKQSDEKFQEKLTEEQLANIAAVPDKADAAELEVLGLSVVDGKLCITYEEG